MPAAKFVTLMGRRGLRLTSANAANWADFAAGNYFLSGVSSGSFAGWLTAASASFSAASARYYVNSSGLYASASSGVARFDYNPVTLGALGLLLEGAATNVLQRSQTFANATWQPVAGITVTDNNATSPDGTADAALFSASAYHSDNPGRFQVVSGGTTANGKYTISRFFKKGTGNYGYINFSSNGPSGHYVTQVFDTNALVLGESAVGGSSGTKYDAQIIDVGSGWCLCTLTASISQADAYCETAMAPLLTGNTFSLYGEISGDSGGGGGLTATSFAWQADAVLNQFPTSPIFTTAAAASRSADSLTRTRTSPTILTTMVEAITARGIGTVAQTIWQIDDGTASNRIRVYRDTSRHIHVNVTSGGVDQADLDLGSIADNTTFRVAFRAQVNDFAASLNGGAVVTDSSGTMPSGMTNERYGADSSGNQWFGHYVQHGDWTGIAASNAEVIRLARLPFDVSAGVPYFEHDGASLPWYSTANQPTGLYDPVSQKTVVAWEGWQPVSGTFQRVVEVSEYDHAARRWSNIYVAGTNTLTNDIHGTPSRVNDADGYRYVFYGAHSSPVRIASTTNPRDISSWRDLSSIASSHTFLCPRLVGSSIYLFDSTFDAGNLSVQGAIEVIPATFSAGVLTWGSAQRLVDGISGGNGWVPLGQVCVVGSKLHLAWTWGRFVGDFMTNVYYGIYDPATGGLSNYSGSVVVAAGSLPINFTTMDASFKVFSVTTSGFVNLTIDAAGASHVVFTDSTATPNVMKHITSADGWASAHSVFTYPNAVQYSNTGCPAPNSNGGVDIYFSDGAAGAKDGEGFNDVAGNIKRLTRSASGVWDVSPTLVLAMGSKALYAPSAIPNAHPNARVMFTEVSTNQLTVDGGLKGYMLGDSGFLLR